MRSWVVKGSPRENDLDEMLVPGVLQPWRTKKPPKAWAPGDRLFFWKSSPASRMVGIGELVSLSGWDGDLFFFDVRYLSAPFARPVSQEELRRIPVLGEASFLKAGPAGTVFPLTDEQAGILLATLLDRNSEVAPLADWQTGRVATSGDEDWLTRVRSSPNYSPEKGIRTLSVKQPWAWAILHGGKDIENRSFSTKIRGTIALHASQREPATEALDELRRRHHLTAPDDLPLGQIVGLVDIIDCTTSARSRWAYPGEMRWRLANPVPLPPRPATGAVGFWRWKP